MDGVWRTPTPVAKLFRSVVELLHHVLRQSLGNLYLTAREVFSFSLSLSLSLAIYGSFPQSLFDHAEAKPLGYFVHAKPKTCQVAELAEHTPPKQNFASSRLHTLFYVVVYFIAKRCAPSN